MKSYGLVFTLEIHAPVEEHNGLSEGLRLVLEEHINEITQEERVPALDELGLIGEDLLDVVLEDSLDADEDTLVLLFGVHVAQKPEYGDGGIDDHVWLGVLHERAVLDEVLMASVNICGKVSEIERLL